MTQRDDYVKALKARGATEAHTTSSKFVRLDTGARTYYVGRAGALRVCDAGGSIKSSVPVNDRTKAALVKEAHGDCSFPDCKCIVGTRTSDPLPACPRGLDQTVPA